MQDERSSRTQRRILVLGMCLSYLGCLLALWYIWNAPRQPFDMFWLHIGANRFTLIVIPLLIFCACYFKLCCLSGDMLKMRDRQLDERQRMVRDSAHRTAYKIVTLLCLLIPIYLAAQGLFANNQTQPAKSASPALTAQPPIVIDYATKWVMATGSPSPMHYTLVQPDISMTWISASALAASADGLPLHAATLMDRIALEQTRLAMPPAVTSPHASLNAGVYYGLVLLTLLIIIYTLPKAIIAWQER